MHAQRCGRGFPRRERLTEKKCQGRAAFGGDLKAPQLREGGLFRPSQYRAASPRLQGLLNRPKGVLRRARAYDHHAREVDAGSFHRRRIRQVRRSNPGQPATLTGKLCKRRSKRTDFAANYNNELSYDRYYATLPHDQAMHTVRELIAEPETRWIDKEKDGVHREKLRERPGRPAPAGQLGIERGESARDTRQLDMRQFADTPNEAMMQDIRERGERDHAAGVRLRQGSRENIDTVCLYSKRLPAGNQCFLGLQPAASWARSSRAT